MHTRATLSLAIALAVSTVSVHAADSDETKLANSLKTWQELKAKHSGNYSYKVRWSSFAGFGRETEIVVRNNKVVERRYREFNNRPVLPVAPPKPGKPAPKPPQGKTWVEKGTDLGSHKQGAAIKTLDELYAEAKRVLGRELPQFQKRYLRFNKQGLLLSCFTVDTRIADDAPTKGVIISSITLGGDKKKADAGKPKPAKTVYRAPNGKAFPAHWGAPPLRQTRDLRPLPGGYGRGSGTLARWIQQNLDRDAQAKQK